MHPSYDTSYACLCIPLMHTYASFLCSLMQPHAYLLCILLMPSSDEKTNPTAPRITSAAAPGPLPPPLRPAVTCRAAPCPSDPAAIASPYGRPSNSDVSEYPAEDCSPGLLGPSAAAMKAGSAAGGTCCSASTAVFQQLSTQCQGRQGLPGPDRRGGAHSKSGRRTPSSLPKPKPGSPAHRRGSHPPPARPRPSHPGQPAATPPAGS